MQTKWCDLCDRTTTHKLYPGLVINFLVCIVCGDTEVQKKEVA